MDIIAKHKPFKNTGDDFVSSNPMFAFYFYKYYISVVKSIFDDVKEQSDRVKIE